MQPSFFDLSARTKLRISGPDASRFLNGQLTNDIAKATPSAAIQACVLNAKGKLNAHLFVSRGENSFLLDAAPELRETIAARLERYIIADDVQVEDVSQSMSIFHCISDIPDGLPPTCRIVSANRFAENGADIWISGRHAEELRQQLATVSKFYTDDEAEVFRIERGIPRWGRELTEEIIPIEANLEPETIDYFKGCYIGQEVISRMKMSGQSNKRLCGLRSASVREKMQLFSTGDGKKSCGWVTSACRSERLGAEIALGYVKRGFNAIGTELEAGDETSGAISATVKIVDLPFS